VGDRSLEFELRYLGPSTVTLAGGMELPSAVFSLPREIEVKQRRKAFRVSVASPVTVDMIDHDGNALASPWSDEHPAAPTTTGRLADLSFSGARIVVDREAMGANFAVGGRLHCRMRFAESETPVMVLGVIRRSTVGVVDQGRTQEEIGIEFLVAHDTDREALEFIRQYVLQVQRSRLARRLTHV
jgi:c-di-GMP-binding flagellar brake protein YcgR